MSATIESMVSSEFEKSRAAFPPTTGKPLIDSPVRNRCPYGSGMPAIKVISSLTRIGANILGKQRDLGTIEPGKLADIIVVDGNPLYDITALAHVEMVVKGGQVLK